ncbi:hypothetical protein [Rhizobium sp. GN54]|uniref:hypothetical protein n=1 Tax=Rhizobium sp. GN54 TaxID=2898150 RepID=UPI001E4E8871|nr:hypothetical protein [Rhizobium sp. GN54]MCD2184335.1 hypothetical protein [Rhizobium sp. GN54]
MLATIVDLLGLCLLLGVASFIGSVWYVASKDYPLMRRDPNYMSFFFIQRKRMARLLLALGLLNVTTMAALLILISIRDGRL